MTSWYCGRGPSLGAQHLCGCSQTSVTPVPGGLMPPSGSHRYQACTWCTYMPADKTLIHRKEDV